MKNHLALIISRIAHPISLILVFMAYTFFSIHSLWKATWTLTVITAIGIIPLVIWNQSRTKKGIYTNFDVSVRKDRYSMFTLLTVLTLLVILFIWTSNQPWPVFAGSLVLLLLVVTSFVLNFWLKVSLHMAVAFYVSLGLWQIHPLPALLLLMAIPFIAWSRIQLERHKTNELLIGGMVGLLCGVLLLWVT
ncbi:hypothetical protein [Cyclobacterium sp.]|uniref:hypothetical protein n=1 Tax=Cyclobacterium sp. TaxID=1966343 RepID=UPI0019941192|nr:hypothetical protein [Cyclobacterium sp.]MBD3627075.1 hypothetical protein [Cyclobacterium sp.]